MTTQFSGNVCELPQLKLYELNENFATSGAIFKGLIHMHFSEIYSNFNHKKKRLRLLLNCIQNRRISHRVIVLLYDDWITIFDKLFLFRDSFKILQTEITFYGCECTRLPSDITDEIAHGWCLILDGNTHENAFIELRTSISRITGQKKGLRLSLQFIHNLILNENAFLQFNKELMSNANHSYFLNQKKSYSYTAISELTSTNIPQNIYGYVTFCAPTNTTSNSASHAFSKQLQIRDGSCDMQLTEDFLQIMIFSDFQEHFPHCQPGDILRIHRIKIQRNQRNKLLQGIISYDSKQLSVGRMLYSHFIVIDGNLSLPANKTSVKQISSENYSWQEIIDPFVVQLLKKRYQEYAIFNNIGNVNSAMNLPQTPLLYLADIQSNHQRLNICCIIVGREESKMNENPSFSWIIWDGSKINEKLNINLCDTPHTSFTNESIIGSSVYLKCVITDEYKFMQCRMEIKIGGWINFSHILLNRIQNNNYGISHELVFDNESQIETIDTVDIFKHQFIQQRLQNVFHHICRKSQLMTKCGGYSKSAVQYKLQSLTPIKSIIEKLIDTNVNPLIVNARVKHLNKILNEKKMSKKRKIVFPLNRNIIKRCNNCLYKIRGKCVGYQPRNIHLFTREIKKKDNQFEFLFQLQIQDASDACIHVIFENIHAKVFFGIDDEINCDLDLFSNYDLYAYVKQCMDILCSDCCIIELLIRSYKVNGYDIICYKCFDTQFIHSGLHK